MDSIVRYCKYNKVKEKIRRMNQRNNSLIMDNKNSNISTDYKLERFIQDVKKYAEKVSKEKAKTARKVMKREHLSKKGIFENSVISKAVEIPRRKSKLTVEERMEYNARRRGDLTSLVKKKYSSEIDLNESSISLVSNENNRTKTADTSIILVPEEGTVRAQEAEIPSCTDPLAKDGSDKSSVDFFNKHIQLVKQIIEVSGQDVGQDDLKGTTEGSNIQNSNRIINEYDDFEVNLENETNAIGLSLGNHTKFPENEFVVNHNVCDLFMKNLSNIFEEALNKTPAFNYSNKELLKRRHVQFKEEMKGSDSQHNHIKNQANIDKGRNISQSISMKCPQEEVSVEKNCFQNIQHFERRSQDIETPFTRDHLLPPDKGNRLLDPSPQRLPWIFDIPQAPLRKERRPPPFINISSPVMFNEMQPSFLSPIQPAPSLFFQSPKMKTAPWPEEKKIQMSPLLTNPSPRYFPFVKNNFPVDSPNFRMFDRSPPCISSEVSQVTSNFFFKPRIMSPQIHWVRPLHSSPPMMNSFQLTFKNTSPFHDGLTQHFPSPSPFVQSKNNYSQQFFPLPTPSPLSCHLPLKRRKNSKCSILNNTQSHPSCHSLNSDHINDLWRHNKIRRLIHFSPHNM